MSTRRHPRNTRTCPTFDAYFETVAREERGREARTSRRDLDLSEYMQGWSDMMDDRTRSNRRRMWHW